jgi:hypothetical protein
LHCRYRYSIESIAAQWAAVLSTASESR